MYYLAAYFILYSIVRTGQVKSHHRAKSTPALYDGAQVWRTAIWTMSDVALIHQLMEHQELSIWHLSPDEAMFLVQPEHKLKVHRLLSARGLNHTVAIMDVQRRVDEQRLRAPAWSPAALRRGHRMDWEQFPTLQVIHEYLNHLATLYPSVCKQKVIGYSTEKRPIKMIKVSNGNPRNKGILVVAGQHAREWIAITSALFVLREIVTKFDDHPTFIQNKNWYIIPLLNPDGYRYTYTKNRFWRKNRRPVNHCVGVDLNRNFGYMFNISGITNHNECAYDYSGPHQFSEPETRAFRNTTLRLKDHLSAVVDLHSYGQYILYPWACKPEPTPDDAVLNTTSHGIFKAILEFKKRRYTFGQLYNTIYPGTGGLIDWTYFLGIRHIYTIEGPDTGDHGFLLPAQYIQEAGQEMLIALTHLASAI